MNFHRLRPQLADIQNIFISDSDGENQITTVAEIHPVPEAAVAVNSSDVMLDNNAHVCDFKFLGVKPKANIIPPRSHYTQS
nr:unnamed protein product [Callosobruchus chinensis]